MREKLKEIQIDAGDFNVRLVDSVIDEILELIVAELPPRREIDYSYVNIPEEWRAEPSNLEAVGYNAYRAEFMRRLK